jgi:FHA domain-containing protein
MVFSWDAPSAPVPGGEIKTIVLPSPKRAGSSSDAPAPSPVELPRAAPVAPESARPAGQPAANAAARDALLEGFLRGAGMEELKLAGGLTPEFMTLLGQLLRESISGTLELLLARALTKREVRAQATVIVARENNPLKFSPNVEAAFANLLADQARGFMGPVDALRDAYNDLRSHQFGVMAGMRAALEGVLARFDPAQLEQRLAQKSMLASLVPSSRRARLWELYEQLYRDISREAEDDFQALFGKAFLRAYEAQIDKLEQEEREQKG